MTHGTRLVMGKVGAAHGIKGALKIHSYTQPKEQLCHYLPWQLHIKQQWVPAKVITCQAHGPLLIAYFEGYTDRDQARLLTGTDIGITRNQLPPLPTGEFYWQDLIGLAVFNLEGVELGTVNSLIETGANDVLVVKQGKKERLIPYLPGQFVKQINLNTRRIDVDWDPDF